MTLARRTVLILAGVSAAALADAKPATPAGESKIEMVEVLAANDSAPSETAIVARCAVIRPTGHSADKAISLCAYLESNGVPAYRDRAADPSKKDRIGQLDLNAAALQWEHDLFTKQRDQAAAITQYLFYGTFAPGYQMRQPPSGATLSKLPEAFTPEYYRAIKQLAEQQPPVKGASPGATPSTSQTPAPADTLTWGPSTAQTPPPSPAPQSPPPDGNSGPTQAHAQDQTVPVGPAQAASGASGPAQAALPDVNTGRPASADAGTSNQAAAPCGDNASSQVFVEWLKKGGHSEKDAARAVRLLDSYYAILGPVPPYVVYGLIAGLLLLLPGLGVGIGRVLAGRRDDRLQHTIDGLASISQVLSPSETVSQAASFIGALPGEARRIVWRLDDIAAQIGDLECMRRTRDSGPDALPNLAKAIVEERNELAALRLFITDDPQSDVLRTRGQVQEFLSQFEPRKNPATVDQLLEQAKLLLSRRDVFIKAAKALGAPGEELAQSLASGDAEGIGRSLSRLKSSLETVQSIEKEFAFPPAQHPDLICFIRELWRTICARVSRSDGGPSAILQNYQNGLLGFEQLAPVGLAETPRTFDGILANLKSYREQAENLMRDGQRNIATFEDWRTILSHEFGRVPDDDFARVVPVWGQQVRDARATAERVGVLERDLAASDAFGDDSWLAAAALMRRLRYTPAARSSDSATSLRHRFQADEIELFAIRCAGVAGAARLDAGIEVLRRAGREDVIKLLRLEGMSASTTQFLQAIEPFEDGPAPDPQSFWDRAIFPHLASGWLHDVIRAEAVLDIYFASDPAFDEARGAVSLMAEQARCAAQLAGARVRSPELLCEPPAGADHRYSATRELREIPEIRQRARERERKGGDFVVDLHSAGFNGPHGNTAFTVILFNPADWG